MPTVGFGKELFLDVAKRIKSAASPSGKMVAVREMKLALAALEVDGFTKEDKKLLKTEFSNTPMTAAAKKLWATATAGIDATPTYERGSYQAFTGTVQELQLMGIGGEVPPSGNYLMLDEELSVGGVRTNKLFLGYDTQKLRSGQKVTVHGRLDLSPWGGVETPGGHYVALTGLSNLTAGEPKFNGKDFVNAAGAKLPMLAYNAPMIMDAPANIFVLDANAKKAFVGHYGGFIPIEANIFHGFTAARAIQTATTTDQRQVKVSGGKVYAAGSGKELAAVGAQGTRKWYVDPVARALYGLTAGKVDQVVRLQKGDIYGGFV